MLSKRKNSRNIDYNRSIFETLGTFLQYRLIIFTYNNLKKKSLSFSLFSLSWYLIWRKFVTRTYYWLVFFFHSLSLLNSIFTKNATKHHQFATLQQNAIDKKHSCKWHFNSNYLQKEQKEMEQKKNITIPMKSSTPFNYYICIYPVPTFDDDDVMQRA